MSISRPTPSEVREFDRLIQVGMEFTNRHDQGTFSWQAARQPGGNGRPIPAGTRRIRITRKFPGNIIEYQTIAHPRYNARMVFRGTMSTKVLMTKFRSAQEGEDIAVAAVRKAADSFRVR